MKLEFQFEHEFVESTPEQLVQRQIAFNILTNWAREELAKLREAREKENMGSAQVISAPRAAKKATASNEFTRCMATSCGVHLPPTP